MKILSKDRYDLARKLFEGFEEATCQCVLDGEGGTVYVDNENAPSYAICVYADFAFFTGSVKQGEVDNIIKELLQSTQNAFLIFVPYKEKWLIALEQSKIVRKFTRYAIERKKEPFDREKLKRYIEALPEKYKLCMITKGIAEKVLQEQWCKDFCATFPSVEDYLKRGVGFVIMDGEKVIAGASSYSCYHGGIDIEVDTKEEYRRQGLATIAAARLILECEERGLYPSWDAANMISVHTAERLGYKYKEEYAAFITIGK